MSADDPSYVHTTPEARPTPTRWRWRLTGRPISAKEEPSRLEPARAWWRTLQPREQALVATGAAVLSGFLIWTLVIKGPLQMLREGPARLDALDAQTHAMQRLAAETRELRAAAPMPPAQSLAALQAASARLGDKARLAVQGDRAVLTLNEIDGETLRSWLAEVRSGARARTTEAQLARGTRGFTGTVTVTFGGTP